MFVCPSLCLSLYLSVSISVCLLPLLTMNVTQLPSVKLQHDHWHRSELRWKPHSFEVVPQPYHSPVLVHSRRQMRPVCISADRQLYLNANQLTGNLPGTLGQAAALSLLSVEDNALTGEVPAGISNWERMAYADPAYEPCYAVTRSSRCSPTPVAVVVTRHLSLGNNQLSGSLPEGTSRLTAITYVFTCCVGGHDCAVNGFPGFSTAER